MDWSEGHSEGFALAAAIHGDASAALAEAGLDPDSRKRAVAVARTLSAAERNARRRWVRARLRRDQGPCPDQTGRAPRALSLLARRVAPELGQQWLHGAPLPRPGFAPEPALIELLSGIAVHPARMPESANPDARRPAPDAGGHNSHSGHNGHPPRRQSAERDGSGD